MDERKKYDKKNLLAILFCVVFAGLVFFVSAFPSADDELLFASHAQNQAVTGKLEPLQLFGNDRLRGKYINIAPVHVFLGAMAYKIAEFFNTGGLQVMFLLNPFYVALTAVILVMLCLRRGYDIKLSLISGLLFCFTTLVFPYSKTFFREPLAMLLLILSYYFLECALSSSKPIVKRFFFFVLCLGFYFSAVWTKEYLLIAFPLFFVKLVKSRFNFISFLKELGRRKEICTLLFIFLLITLTLFGLILRRNVNSRISFNFIKYMLISIPNMPHEYFHRALLGSFISPSKGFLIYSPAFVFACLFPLTNKWKLQWDDWVFTMGLTIGMVIMQALAYDAGWWNFTWGTRFLLPVIPFWVLLLLPWLKLKNKKNKVIFKWILLALLFVGFAIQLGGVLVSDADYASYFYEEKGQIITEESMWQWEELPFITYWKMLFSGWHIDIAWLRALKTGLLPALLLPIFCAVIIFLGIPPFLWMGKVKLQQYYHVIIILLFALTLALPIMALFSIRSDPKYGSNQIVYWDAVRYVKKSLQASDLVAVDAYADPFWLFYFNFGFTQNPWVSMPQVKYSLQRKRAFYPRMEETIKMLKDHKEAFSRLVLISENLDDDTGSEYARGLVKYGFCILEDKIFSGWQNNLKISLWFFGYGKKICH